MAEHLRGKSNIRLTQTAVCHVDNSTGIKVFWKCISSPSDRPGKRGLVLNNDVSDLDLSINEPRQLSDEYLYTTTSYPAAMHRQITQ